MISFDSFQFPASIRDAIARLGFEKPTPIQQQAIPIALQGRDLIGCAQTGTGKTAAYCLPLLAHLLQTPGRRALVLVPTRELARQIEEFWQKLSQRLPGMSCTSLIGGMAMSPQIRALSRKPRLVIATPGRLIDHLERRTIDVAQTSFLVLDEADRMLDMGFEPQLSRIAKFLPKDRQTLLFSATVPMQTEKLSGKFIRNAARVTIGENSRAAEKVSQSLVVTEPARKNDTLLDEINRCQGDSILIFARTKSRTDRVARYLSSYGLDVALLHGGRSQGQRNAAISAFRAGQARILVATDIASRGIDVASVGFVINYDLPQAAEDYVHRIGRTGRAGASGIAVSLITHEDRGQWREIVSLLKKTGSAIPVPRESVETKKGGMPDVQAQSRNPGQAQPRKSAPREKSGETRRTGEAQGRSREPRTQFGRWRRPRSRWDRSRPSASAR